MSTDSPATPSPGGTPPSGPHFLADGSAAASFLRGTDWDGSPLRQPAAWPRPLRQAVSLLLDSAVPMWLAWGPQRAMVYNHPYAAMLGDKHPGALGTPLQTVVDVTKRHSAERALQGLNETLERRVAAEGAERHNGVLDAGVHLIGKPFTIEELASRVRQVLDSGA